MVSLYFTPRRQHRGQRVRVRQSVRNAPENNYRADRCEVLRIWSETKPITWAAGRILFNMCCSNGFSEWIITAPVNFVSRKNSAARTLSICGAKS